MLNYTAISVNFITHDSQSTMHKDAEHPINLTLELSDVEYLLSYLDEEPQASRAHIIHEEIWGQTYA